tara:strand:- start:3666 stop:4856 length:1191 start_codon:yes stop_codon:yes gene_type:complete
MLFQPLDNKNECFGIYANGKLAFHENFADLDKTWAPSSYLNSKDIEYAGLYCGGKTLTEICPENIKSKWIRVSNRMRAFMTSFEEAKINLDDICFYKLVPEQFLLEYFDLKNLITEHVFANYEKPKNYEFLSDLQCVLTAIEHQKLNLDLQMARRYITSLKGRNFLQKIRKIQPYCKYNIFGTVTGRLSTYPDSFPILTMDKNYRTIINPSNQWFLELDYNAAELRVMIALLGHKQPNTDLHEWNRKNIYRSLGTRDEAKKRIFAWLYDPRSKDFLSNKAYDRDSIIEKYWNGDTVENIFDRTIKSVDKHHALNYIIQSTTADLVLQQMIKIHDFLQNKKSFIAFCIHDSVVIDLADEDKKYVPELINIFSKTGLGNFKVNIGAGINFGDIRKLML